MRRITIEIDDNDMAREITQAIEDKACDLKDVFPGTSEMLMRVSREIKGQTIGVPIEELNDFFK